MVRTARLRDGTPQEVNRGVKAEEFRRVRAAAKLAESRRVRSVKARLTRGPITPFERGLILRLAPGKNATWVTGKPKRFLRDLQHLETLSDAQRQYLWSLARQFARRL